MSTHQYSVTLKDTEGMIWLSYQHSIKMAVVCFHALEYLSSCCSLISGDFSALLSSPSSNSKLSKSSFSFNITCILMMVSLLYSSCYCQNHRPKTLKKQRHFEVSHHVAILVGVVSSVAVVPPHYVERKKVHWKSSRC